jgi:hypothetical protein
MTDRDSFNPILNEAPLPLFDFGGPGGHSRGHTALVYLTDLAAIDPAAALRRRMPALRERLRHQFWRYEVDVAHHPTYVSLELPAQEEAFSFTAKVCFTWTVSDAAAVARYGIRDTKAIIWPFLDQTLRSVSRHFGIERCGEAEGEMNDRLKKEAGDLDYGIRLSSCAVDLFLDAAAQQHLAKRYDARRSQERAVEEHTLHVLREEHARKEGELRGKLEVAAARHQRELEAAAMTHDLDLKEQRRTFYRKAVDGGSFGFLVLQLIENPSDIKAVVDMLHTSKDVYYERARTVIKDLLDNELVDAADVDPLREHAIGQLRAALDIAAPQGSVMVDHDRRTTVMKETKDERIVAQEEESTRLSAA